ncbi:MAG: GDP-mannose 4,6-dehydratase [Leptolyngbyaceae cyanobacterium]
MTRTALITGITGQDGYYLSRLLVQKGYRVVGLIPPSRRASIAKLNEMADAVTVAAVDLTDGVALRQVVADYKPREIYNLAAPSFVPATWDVPLGTLDLITVTATRLLNAVRQTGLETRFYQASSSEIFGDVQVSPQSDTTPFRPKNPYGAAKLHAHWTMVHHRDRYGLFACSGVLYNHESPRRPPQFVTRKVALAAASIKLGLSDRLSIGSLNAKRDWGYAGDYVDAMWRMLQANNPEDYVIGTGTLHTVQDLVETAFASVDLEWQKYVDVDAQFLRQDEHFQLMADPTKANAQLQWHPQVDFAQLIATMVKTDLDRLQAGTVKPLPVL